MSVDPQFDSLSLLMCAAAVYTVVQLVRRGRAFLGGPLGPGDRDLAVQTAVFVLTPPAVLIHELGHAVAVVALGGHVARLHFLGFSGYVVPEGLFSARGDWLITAAGPLAQVVVAFAYLFAGARLTRLSETVRYTLVYGGLFQIVFALIGYPVLSLFTHFGDWVEIYSFSTVPALALVGAAGHAAAGGGAWLWWRARLHGLVRQWERSAPDAQPDPAAVREAAESDDPARLLEAARAQLQRGRPHQAVGTLRRALDRAESAEDRALEQHALVNLFLALTYDHQTAEAVRVFGRLAPHWLEQPPVQKALDLIQLRTGRRPG